MKFFRKKVTSFLLLLIVAANFQSCSWIAKRQSLFDEKMKKPSPSSVVDAKDMVTKSQYDQLLGKYEQLLDKIKKAEFQSVSSKKMGHGKRDFSENKLIGQLSKITPVADLAETVDVFGKNGLASKDILDNSGRPPEMSSLSDNDIQEQLTQLQKAKRLIDDNKVDSALIILKDLEESSNKHIRVRSKYYLAELLFKQSEYDLALQIYEEIIHKYAFSGLVVNSLGRIIACSDKLKLAKKQERYYSILRDFFES